MQNARSTPTNPWIINPVLDSLFCCGGLVWILLAITMATNIVIGWNEASSEIAILSLIALHLFSDTHVAATLFRVAAHEQTRSKHLKTTIALLVACLTVVLTGFALDLIGALLRGYFVFFVFHYIGQTYGLMLIYCAKRKYALTQNAKSALLWTLRTAAALGAVRQFSPSLLMPQTAFIQPIPLAEPIPEIFVLAALFVLCLSMLILTVFLWRQAQTQKQSLPVPAFILLITTLCMFSAPQPVSFVLWMFVPAFFHGCQYLALTASQHLRQAATQVKGNLFDQSFDYFGVLVFIAALLFVVFPLLLQSLGMPRLSAYVAVFLIINLHHFAVDGIIWKLRDPTVHTAVT